MKKILFFLFSVILILGFAGTALPQSDFEQWVKGNKLMDQNKPKEALQYLEKAVELKPGSAENQDALGLCYYKLNDYKKAATHLERASRIDPKSTWHYYLGISYINLERLDDAVSVLKQGLNYEEKPERKKEMEQYIEKVGSYKSVVSQGMTHLEDGNYQLALKEFKHALSYIETKEARAGYDRAMKLFGEKNKVFIRVLIAAAVAAAVAGVLLMSFMRNRKKKYLESILPQKIRTGIRSGKFEETIQLLDSYVRAGGRVTSFSQQEVFSLYRGAGGLDKLAGTKLPDSYYQYFTKELVRLKDFAGAYKMYLLYKSGGGKPQGFTPKEFLAMFTGINALEDMFKENPPSLWMVDFAEEFISKKDPATAFGMLKQGEILKDADFFRGDANSAEAPVYRIFGIFDKAGRQADILKILLDKPDAFLPYYSMIAQTLIEKEKLGEAVSVLEKKIAYQASVKKESASADYELLFSIYEKTGKLNEAQVAKIPEKYKVRVAEAKLAGGKYMEALDMIMEKPRSEWKERDYSTCLRIYEGLEMKDQVHELFGQFAERIKLLESKEIYYEFALFFEKEQKIKNAIQVYEMFINSKMPYKDVESRCANLKKSPSERTKEAVSPQKTDAAPAHAAEVPKAVSGHAEPAPATGRGQEEGMIKGRYRTIKSIGSGYASKVYEGTDTRTGRKVAIKKMRGELLADKKDLGRFMSEAETVMKFDHPNIAMLLDAAIEGRDCWLICEFIEGYTLEKIMKGRMKVGEAWDIIEYVSSALYYAHLHNVVHGDLTTSNILIPRGTTFDIDPDSTKVTDFGTSYIAKDIIMMATGEMPDKPVFMAPEQHLGTHDKRSDIFSLGVILYKMLTGVLPFEGPDFLPQKEKMAFKPVTFIAPDLPAKIDVVIKTCLQADLSKRYATMEDFMEEMRKI